MHNVSSSTTNMPTTKNAASGPSRFLEGCAFDQFVDDFLFDGVLVAFGGFFLLGDFHAGGLPGRPVT